MKKIRSLLSVFVIAAYASPYAVMAQAHTDGRTPPAFAWRGCMIDVSRHWFPESFLRQQIVTLSRYGINRLHLHLTDAGGWRMEIRQYPQLTQLSAWRTESDWEKWWEQGDRRYVPEGKPGAYGHWYSQAALRELVAFASAHGIEIVPEIEMPGHSEEVLAAYPELRCLPAEDEAGAEGVTRQGGMLIAPNTGDFCPANEQVYTFLENVLTEVMEVFPSEYIHIGGDEAGKTFWSRCTRCRAKMRELGKQDVNALQAYMVQRMTRWINAHGRRVIAWDEIVEDGAGDASVPTAKGNAVMVWRDAAHARRALEKGYDVILSPASHCYLDYYQDAPPTQPRAIGGYLPAEKVYSLNPHEGIPEEMRTRILGVQGNLWTEYIDTTDKASYMLYPRILALAEIGLRGTERMPWKQFRPILEQRMDSMRRQGENVFDLRHEAGARRESLHRLKHKGRGARVTYAKPYRKQYAAGGETALTDGWRGDWTHADGRWQGFMTGDCLDLTVDLGRRKHIKRIAIDFLQSSGAWIYLPADFSLSVSEDGRTFREVMRRQETRRANAGAEVHQYEWTGRERVRYLRLCGTATGEGEWIFLDEIAVD